MRPQDNTQTTPHRVLIGDSLPLASRGLVCTLEKRGLQCAEAGSTEEVLQRLKSDFFDLLILDRNLPFRSPLDILPDIFKALPGCKVVLLATSLDPIAVKATLKGGATAVIKRDSDPDIIGQLVEDVISGDGNRDVAGLVADDHQEPHQALSVREFEVFRHLCEGSRITSFAPKLGLSVKTASTYKSRIFRKLGVNSDAGLVRYYFEHRLNLPE